MGVAYPLNMPGGLRAINLEASNAITINRSPFSFQSWRQDWGGDRWLISGSARLHNAAEVNEWRGFFSALAGGRGSFLAGDPWYPGPKGSVSITAAIDGSNQYGTLLNLRNFTPNKATVLMRGDYFSIGQRLYVVLEDRPGDGVGNVQAPIFPSLRDSPANLTSLNFAKPKGRFRLLDYDLSSQVDGFYSISFRGEEDI
jgi:hypothetical protein